MEIAKLEKQIVAAAIASRSTWEQLVQLGALQDLSPEGQRVLEFTGTFYANDPSSVSADLSLISSALGRSLNNPKHQELFQAYLSGVPESVSTPNVLVEVASLKRHRIGQKLAAALVSQKPATEIDALIADLQSTSTSTQTTSVQRPEPKTGWDIAELMQENFNRANLIKLSPKTLNDRMDGGMMRGDQMIVFAATEMGKTLFAVNLCAGFLVQNLKVLYCKNEEPKARTNLRLINRLSGKTKSDLYDQAIWEEVRQILRDKGYANFSIVDLSPGTLDEIEGLVKELNPDVVVVDQIRNLDVANENRTNQLERAATGMRNLAKRRNFLSVGLTQAGATAFGKSILNRGDIDGSNVGIPGQADLMVGIGANEEQEAAGIRWISLPKAKGGDHTPFAVSFDPLLSKVQEV
jgi:archaellum biogenesis ATPase FlaH